MARISMINLYQHGSHCEDWYIDILSIPRVRIGQDKMVAIFADDIVN